MNIQTISRRRFQAPQSQSWHSSDTAEAQAELLARFADLSKRVQALKADSDELKRREDFVSAGELDEVRSRLHQCLTDEIELRTEAVEFYDSIEAPDRRAESKRLADAPEAIEADIISRLESIGFLPFDKCRPVQGCWKPGDVQRHPEVIGLREVIAQLRGYTSGDSSGRMIQLEAIKAAKRELGKLRSATLPV